MFVSYAMLRNEQQDLGPDSLLFNAVLGFVIATLGIIQSIVGLKFLNPATLSPELEGLGNLTRISPITHRAIPVPTSVFVSGGRFAVYMTLVIIMALGTQAYILLTRRKGAVYGLFGIGLSLIGAMQSGSRACIIFALASIFAISVGILWGAPWRWGQGHRLVKAVRRSIIVGVVVLFLMRLNCLLDSTSERVGLFSETLYPYKNPGLPT